MRKRLGALILAFNKKFDLKNLGYLPRWMVLFFDVIVCLVSLIIVYFILDNIGHKNEIPLGLFNEIYIILGVNLFYFAVFKTYSGLIRHSSFKDASKLFLASFGTYITLTGVNVFYQFYTQSSFFPTSRLFLYFITSASLLFFYRVLIKQIFHVARNYFYRGRRTRAFVYGTSPYAISFVEIIKESTTMKFEIVGFVRNEKRQSRKQILGLPIYSTPEKTSDILISKNAEALIVVEEELKKKDINAILDECLENGIKVYRVPVITDIGADSDYTNKIENIQIEDLLPRSPIKLDKAGIAKQLNNNTVLITGAAGSIGSEIVRQVATYNPDRLILVDNAESPLHALSLEIKSKFPELNFEPILADVGLYDRMNLVFETFNPNVVYHAAAYKHVPLMEKHPSEAVRVNINGTKNLADLSVKHKVSKFVMVSTDKAVNPSNVMGATKRAAEMYVQSYNNHLANQGDEGRTRFITTRFGNVLGSNGSVVPMFKKQIEEGGPVTITHPDIIRYFMTIPEACNLVLEAGAMGKGGEIFIFDMGEAVKILDLAKRMIRLAGFEPDKDIPIKIIGLRPGEKLYEELLSDSATSMPTYNKKIMISRENDIDFDRIKNQVNRIIEIHNEGNKEAIVFEIKGLVPEYKSLNSRFEILDKIRE